jgi:hypothetical protein
MLTALLLFTSTFALEASMSVGKRYVEQRRETVLEMCFLGLFWGLLLLLSTLAFGATFRVTLASVPTLALRLVLEASLQLTLAEATVKADRTTNAFLRLLTIPLLLVVDIALGYRFTQLQLTGVVLMFVALLLAFRHNPRGSRGAWLCVLGAILAVGTISLYKYDITHFNSVVGEQTVVVSGLLIWFYILSARKGRSPLRLLVRPTTGTQSLANGVSIALESFALSMAPAAVVITLKRSFGVVWAIVFGGTYFHEHSLGRKLTSGILLAASIVLIAFPGLHLF